MKFHPPLELVHAAALPCRAEQLLSRVGPQAELALVLLDLVHKLQHLPIVGVVGQERCDLLEALPLRGEALVLRGDSRVFLAAAHTRI